VIRFFNEYKASESSVFKVALKHCLTARRLRKKQVSILLDSSFALFALWIAYSIRLSHPFIHVDNTWPYFLLVAIGAPMVFHFLGVYRWVVRSSDAKLNRQLVKGTIAAGLLLVVTMFLVQIQGLPERSVALIFMLVFAPCVIGSRAYWKHIAKNNDISQKGEPVAIFGTDAIAGRIADLLLLDDNASVRLFIDDNTDVEGSMVRGLPAYTTHDRDIGELLKSEEISRVIIARSSLAGERFTELFSQLHQNGITLQTIPSLAEMTNKRVSVSDIRDVAIQDILGRPEVPADQHLLKANVHGKNVLVTGGGGTIGSELCRQILRVKPKTLIVLDHSEENIYRITEQVRLILDNSEGTIRFVPRLGSVTNKQTLANLFSENSIDTVYHAAAYKHVPIVENEPDAGISVNVFGTHNVLNAAYHAEVSNFTLISTDKAVRPTNVMGATKRLAEMIVQAHAPHYHSMNTSVVRFGNVLDSSGSVVPKFRSQIRSGGPITVTHPEITRYFMTIPEAAQLVLQAGSLGKNGEVFVLDMGESVKIIELARAMISLSGLSENDIPIEFTGIRPGEKMHEELFISEESKQTSLKKISIDFDNYLNLEVLKSKLKLLESSLGKNGNDKTLKKYLFDIIDQTNGEYWLNPSLNQRKDHELAKDETNEVVMEKIS